MPNPRAVRTGLPALPQPGDLFVGAEVTHDDESPAWGIAALPVGDADDVLTVVDGAPAWSPPSAESGSGGFTPDYANAVFGTLPAPATLHSTGSIDAELTPSFEGWVMIAIRYEILVVDPADQCSITLDADAGLGIPYDSRAVFGGPAHESGHLHAMIRPGATYLLGGTLTVAGPGTGTLSIVQILEIPALA